MKRLSEAQSLTLLSMRNGITYAYGMQDAIKDMTDGAVQVSLSSLYASLARLTDIGLIEVDYVENEPSQLGPPRKYYKLTAEGLQQTARITRKYLALAAYLQGAD